MGDSLSIVPPNPHDHKESFVSTLHHRKIIITEGGKFHKNKITGERVKPHGPF
jgi:hypothetical protein